MDFLYNYNPLLESNELDSSASQIKEHSQSNLPLDQFDTDNLNYTGCAECCICNLDSILLPKFKVKSISSSTWIRKCTVLKHQLDAAKIDVNKFKKLHSNLLTKRKKPPKEKDFRRKRYSEKGSEGEKKSRLRVMKYIKEESGDNEEYLQMLVDLLYFLPKATLTKVLEDLDKRQHTSSGKVFCKQPLREFCFKKQLNAAKQMESDPKIISMMYILRKELELGRKKASLICQMFFRDGCYKIDTGRFLCTRFKYGWQSDDVELGWKPYGLLFPKLSVNVHSDKIAAKYLKENCLNC